MEFMPFPLSLFVKLTRTCSHVGQLMINAGYMFQATSRRAFTELSLIVSESFCFFVCPSKIR